MASFNNNISRIEVIVEGLKDLADEMVFVGGACVQFYVPNPDNHDCRPTKDIDCVIQIASYLKFNQFSEKMRSLGFTHDTSTNAPIIRWLYKNIKVDTIPEEGSAGITGFEDIPWFKEGRMYAEERGVAHLLFQFFFRSNIYKFDIIKKFYSLRVTKIIITIFPNSYHTKSLIDITKLLRIFIIESIIISFYMTF